MAASFSKSTELVVTVPDSLSPNPASASSKRFSTLLEEARPIVLTDEQLRTAQAMQLLIRLDHELLEARAQWNQDWFRRIMHARSKAAARLQRRWGKINPPPAISLGTLR